MEFPFGGHNRHHQREEREEEEQFPPPPLPPQHHHHHHEHNMPPPQPDLGYSAFPQESLSYPRPPPQPGLGYSAFPQESLSYPRPPPPTQRFEFEPGYPSVHQTNLGPEPGYASVHHVSHQTDLGPEPGYASVQHVSHQMQQESEPDPSEFRHETHHQHRPHLPSFVHHHTHEGSEVSNKPTVRVFSKAEPGYSLTIRDGHVILARSNENDEFQHWIKDEKYSTRVKDEEGFPSFALVNKATGQALKHSIGATHPVQLIPYNPDVLDESILWAESKDLGDSFRTIRMVNNIRLNMDAFHGDKNHGGVHDGTTVVLWEWKKGDNQRWKIVPY